MSESNGNVDVAQAPKRRRSERVRTSSDDARNSLPGDYIGPRQDCLKDDDFFMAIALLERKRSTDPAFQVGACVVNEEGKVIGIGHNRMPNNCEIFSWKKPEKHYYVCHAELNAIVKAKNVKNCTIYQTLAPCNGCAKLIVQSGIKKVLYLTDTKEDKIEFQTAKEILDHAGIEHRLYKPTRERIDLEFQS